MYVVSGSEGASGEGLARSLLAQFVGVEVPLILAPFVREPEQVEKVIRQAAQTRGIVLHTLVDANLRHLLIRLAWEQNVLSVDLAGPLLARLSEALGQQPLGEPGRYRHLQHEYVKRAEAIECGLKHDDGRDPRGWPLADIVLVGVSRVGKTPLSAYLSVRGWKVANVPLSPPQPPPPELFRLDRRRVVGLTMAPGELVTYRRQRLLGIPVTVDYSEAADVYDEVEAARRIFRRGGFPVVDLTDKSIEKSAEEIVALVNRRLGAEAGPPGEEG